MRHSLVINLVREPLMHFLLIGVAIFCLYAVVGERETGPDIRKIEIGEAEVSALERQFKATWRRQPNADEREVLIANYIREEILVREALALRLDQGDAVIRKRLQQKMEFVFASAASAKVPSRDDLVTIYQDHAAEFEVAGQTAFDQVLLTVDDPEAIQAALNSLNAGQQPKGLRSVKLLPDSLPSMSGREIDGMFGPGFADSIETLLIGSWAGPVRSGYGAHLVRVTQRTNPVLAPFELVEDELRAKWRDIARAEASKRFSRELKQKYRVNVTSGTSWVNQ